VLKGGGGVVSRDLYGVTVVEMVFGSLACSGRVRVDVDGALVDLNGREIPQERVTGGYTRGFVPGYGAR